MRQTIREIEVNVAYRWFLGYSLTEKFLISQHLIKTTKDDLKLALIRRNIIK